MMMICLTVTTTPQSITHSFINIKNNNSNNNSGNSNSNSSNNTCSNSNNHIKAFQAQLGVGHNGYDQNH